MIAFIKKIAPNEIDFAVGYTLVILKLTGEIDWYWLGVTGPFWAAPMLRALLLLGKTVHGKIKENEK